MIVHHQWSEDENNDANKSATYSIAENSFCSGMTNAVDVLKGELDPLLIGDFYSSNTSSLNLQGSSSESNLDSTCRRSYLDRCACSKSFVTADGLHSREREVIMCVRDMPMVITPIINRHYVIKLQYINL